MPPPSVFPPRIPFLAPMVGNAWKLRPCPPPAPAKKQTATICPSLAISRMSQKAMCHIWRTPPQHKNTQKWTGPTWQDQMEVGCPRPGFDSRGIDGSAPFTQLRISHAACGTGHGGCKPTIGSFSARTSRPGRPAERFLQSTWDFTGSVATHRSKPFSTSRVPQPRRANPMAICRPRRSSRRRRPRIHEGGIRGRLSSHADCLNAMQFSQEAHTVVPACLACGHPFSRITKQILKFYLVYTPGVQTIPRITTRRG